MRLASILAVLGLSIASLPFAAGCSSPAGDSDLEQAESEDGLSAVGANSGYFIVRRDMRRCAYPMCGGLFVKRVNQDKTTCVDGSQQDECYVESITYGGMNLSTREEADFKAAVEGGTALIKARTYKKRINRQWYGTLKASEGWLGASGATPDGTFYRAADNGIRCITTPCPTTTATPLNNGGNDYNVIAVHFENTSAPQDLQDRAASALGTSEGVLVAGSVALPKCMAGATDCGPNLMPTEFYLRVTKREGKTCGGRGGNPYCNANQFCSWADGDLCGAADAAGHCAYRPEMCMALYQPVCGCDGKTYSNSCHAAGAGTSVMSQGACAPAAPTCGGFAGIQCPGHGQCVDNPNDSCDPNNGGADCGGICECPPSGIGACMVGHHWDNSPSACACVPD